MEAVLIKSMTFLLIVAFGHVLKRKGFFKKEDSVLISKIVAQITLPAALLSSATKLTFSLATIAILLIGFCANVIMASVGKIVFSKKAKIEQGSAIINCSGYNVGNITIPFAQAFYPGLGLSYVCMFDIGNSLGFLGAAYAWGNNVANGNKFSLVALLKTLSRSVPFMTYVVILTLGILNISLPIPVMSLATTIGSANSFLVMIMIGVTLDFDMTKEQVQYVIKVVGLRLSGFIFFAIVVYFVLPLPMLAKQISILCLVPSAPSIAIVFSRGLGDDSANPALINSISLILGIISSAIVLLLFV